MVLLNATGARFTTADIKDFFLMSDLERPEYMWIPLSQILNRIQTTYNVADYAVNGRVMVVNKRHIWFTASFATRQTTTRHAPRYPRVP